MRALPAQLAASLRDVRLQTSRRVGRAVTTALRRCVVDGQRLEARAVVVATDVSAASSRSWAFRRTATRGLVTWWFAADEAPTESRMLAVDGRGRGAPPGPVWNTGVASNAAPSYAPPGRHLVHATTLLDRPDGEAPEGDVLRHLAEIYGCRTDDWEVVARHRIEQALPATPPGTPVRRPVALGDRAVRLRRPPRHRLHPGRAGLGTPRRRGGPADAGRLRPLSDTPGLHRRARPGRVDGSCQQSTKEEPVLTLTENASTIVKDIAAQQGGPDSTGLRISGQDPTQGLTVTAAEQPVPGDTTVTATAPWSTSTSLPRSSSTTRCSTRRSTTPGGCSSPSRPRPDPHRRTTAPGAAAVPGVVASLGTARCTQVSRAR